MLNKNDLALLKSKNITVDELNKQLDNFKKGFPFIILKSAATPDNGILQIDEANKERFINHYDRNLDLRITKFVPASGAASRMFKALYEFKELYEGNNQGYADFMKTSGLNSILELTMKIERFAFFDELEALLKKAGKSANQMIVYMDYAGLIDAIVGKDGLNYGKLPKALIKFHKYGNIARTSLEEHLVEGALYCKNRQNKVSLHFTISQEHRSLVEAKIKEVLKQYETQYNVSYNIEYSVQKPSTDTIAADTSNNAYRDSDGNLLFRPGGHGALIENLNEIDSDIIFIKNIDNVVIDALKPTTVEYKKLIAGVLLHYQQQIFDYINKLNSQPDKETIDEASEFIEKKLFVKAGNRNIDIEYLLEKLNRPLRVCGMVKNEGEPGGGPFWCHNADGTISLQIVESSQVDKNNAEQMQILQNATHFNPVDLVCSLKDHKGNKFDLANYIDHNTGFISSKSHNGETIKALELPGLWNGAMANWNTIFVEVPIITFNPVKTIDDLLRKEHLAE